MSLAGSFRWLREQPWIWAFLGALAVWLVTMAVVEGRGAGATLSAALSFSVFFVIVGIGQMFVIASGPGNVDLSIPATMVLAGSVAMKVMGGDDGRILIGLAAALATGFGVGVFNVGLIRLLRIPPIIATLSASFVVQSTAIAYGRGLRVRPPASFEAFASAQIGGVPVMAVVIILFAAAMAVVLNRTVYGRSVLAIGQNPRAAWLSGVSVGRIRFLTYTLCATLSALAGTLLAGFSGGASLNMGEEYLLASIAVVVLGGTSVAGGKANVPGIWGAAMFLYLLVTMLNALGVGTGLRLVLTGVIIIAVITVAGGSKER